MEKQTEPTEWAADGRSKKLCRPLHGLKFSIVMFPTLVSLAWGYHSVRLLRRLVVLFLVRRELASEKSIQDRSREKH